jgi:hypothetical protein
VGLKMNHLFTKLDNYIANCKASKEEKIEMSNCLIEVFIQQSKDIQELHNLHMAVQVEYTKILSRIIENETASAIPPFLGN